MNFLYFWLMNMFHLIVHLIFVIFLGVWNTYYLVLCKRKKNQSTVFSTHAWLWQVNFTWNVKKLNLNMYHIQLGNKKWLSWSVKALAYMRWIFVLKCFEKEIFVLKLDMLDIQSPCDLCEGEYVWWRWIIGMVDF